MTRYIITANPQMYMTSWDYSRLTATQPAERDDRGNPITYATRTEAEDARFRLNEQRYVCSNNESGRPLYRVRLTSSLTLSQRERWGL